jgi:hypothetical protein
MSESGNITSGLESCTLVARTIQFVQEELVRWTDRSDRAAAIKEGTLNSQLCKHLDASARERFPLVQFHHEEGQGKKHSVDLSAGFTAGTHLDGNYHSIDDPFLVFECKRLPAPAKNRSREYASNRPAAGGGIQRFKLGLHGARFNKAVMIGYIQNKDSTYWHGEVNTWILELASEEQLQAEVWNDTEILDHLQISPEGKLSRSDSTHSRVGDCVSATIEIVHLWVVMSSNVD